MCDEDLGADPGVPVVTVADARRALAYLADRLHGRPGRKLRLCAVTGTNGKTTTAWLTHAALEAGGLPAGLVGSIYHRSRARVRAATVTTPSADRLHPMLREMVDAGEQACVIEASSHAIAQARLDGLPFACAVLTNVTGDHLDYHGGYESYLETKLDLFRALGRDAVAALNRDEPAWEVFAAETRAKVVTFGLESGGDVRGRVLAMDRNGTELEVRTPLGSLTLRTALIGRHHASNALGAITAALALGVEPEAAAAGIAGVKTVPGRMEQVPVPAPFAVIVDHAHTPEALAATLGDLRPLARRRLWVVFGCGGERDPAHRPRMARVAERFADVVVVTSDNPRRENPMSIIRDVMLGFRSPRNTLLEPDRGEAIRMVLERVGPDDVVVIAGKGHEAYQTVGRTVQPFDDRVEVRRFFAT